MIGKANKLITYLVGQLEINKDKEFEIKEYKPKRSRNANNYAWLLLTKIADVLRLDKEEVYLDMLKHYGQSEMVSVLSEIDVKGYFKYYEKVGEMMYKTHEGLSKDYEVSCEELDFLNDIAKENGVTGSRIMGGGFGGCTINLVRNDLYKQFIADAKQKFNAKYGHEPKVYDVVIGDGSRKLC